MRTHNSSRESADQLETAFVDAASNASEQRSMRSPSTSIRPEQRGSLVPGNRMPPTLRDQTAELLADIDGLPILVRFVVQDLPVKTESEPVSREADMNSLLSSALEKIVDRMRGSPLRRDDFSKRPLAMVELILSGDALVRPSALPNETVLRVGPLELDLIDRTARRGDRQIDLRPREFQLLKYMMQRSDKLLTRATLLKEVWNYKFVPETNLVDVHMGLLRRKLDGADEAPMIHNVRGVGFVLNATPLSQASPTRPAAGSSTPGVKSARSTKGHCNESR